MWSAAPSSKASVPGREVTRTRPEKSGAATEGTRPGPTGARTGTTPRTPLPVPDPRPAAPLSQRLTASKRTSLCFKCVSFTHLHVIMQVTTSFLADRRRIRRMHQRLSPELYCPAPTALWVQFVLVWLAQQGSSPSL